MSVFRTARRLAATAGSLGLVVTAGALLGSPAAHAAGTTVGAAGDIEQISASCVTTTSGRGCVALQLVDKGTAQQYYRGTVSLTPTSGHYMKPVGWTISNPGFIGTSHTINGLAVGIPFVQSFGSMSVPSLIGFTFNVPGHTEHVYAGYGRYATTVASGNALLDVSTEYLTSKSGVPSLYKSANLRFGHHPQSFTAGVARVFGADNSTLLTLSGDKSAQFDTLIPLSKVVRPSGVAVTFTADGHRQTVVEHDRA